MSSGQQYGRSWEKGKRRGSGFLIYESPVQKGTSIKTGNHKLDQSDLPAVFPFYFLLLYLIALARIQDREITSLDCFIPGNIHYLRKYLRDDTFEDEPTFPDLIMPITKKETFFPTLIFTMR